MARQLDEKLLAASVRALWRRVSEFNGQELANTGWGGGAVLKVVPFLGKVSTYFAAAALMASLLEALT